MVDDDGGFIDKLTGSVEDALSSGPAEFIRDYGPPTPAKAFLGAKSTVEKATNFYDAKMDTGLLEDQEMEDFEYSSLKGVNPGLTFGGASAGGKGGKGAAIGTIKVESQGQAPLSVMAKAAQAKQMVANTIANQLNVRSQGLGMMADVSNELATDIEENAADTFKDVDRIFSAAEQQLHGVQSLVDAAKANRINPGQFFKNIGDAGTFASAIAVASGHMAAAMGGGPNTALHIIEGAIKRNMVAQTLNQQHDRAMVAHQIAFVDRLQALGVNKANVGNIHRAALIASAQAQLDYLKASTASMEQLAMIDQVYAQLNAQFAESLVKAFEGITAEATIKYYSKVEASAAARTVAGAARTAVGAQTGQLGGERPVRPEGMARQGQGAAPTGQPGASPASRGAMPKGTPQARLAEGTPEQQARSAAQAFQQHMRDQRRQADEGTVRSYISQFPQEVQEVMNRFPEEAYQPIRDTNQIAEFQLHSGGTTKLVKTARMRYLEENKKDEAVEMQKQAQSVIRIGGMLQELDGYFKRLGRGKHVSTKDGKPIFAPLTDEESAGDIKKMHLLIMNIANAERTRLGSDAIRSVSEWEIWKEIKGVGERSEKLYDLLNTFTRSPQAAANFRRSQFRASLEMQDSDMRAAVYPYFMTQDQMYKAQ